MIATDEPHEPDPVDWTQYTRVAEESYSLPGAPLTRGPSMKDGSYDPGSWPRGCCDDFEYEELLTMAQVLVRHAMSAALKGRANEDVGPAVIETARAVAVQILVERGVSRRRARQLVRSAMDDSTADHR